MNKKCSKNQDLVDTICCECLKNRVLVYSDNEFSYGYCNICKKGIKQQHNITLYKKN